MGRRDRAFVARSVVGPLVKKIVGLAAAAIHGTRLILAESVLRVFTSGPEHNVSPALVGRRTPIGTPSDRQ